MTDLLRPLTGYVPSSEFGRRVVGPPSAALTKDQKKAARNDPLSFRYVAGRKAGASSENAAGWLRDCAASGALTPVEHAVLVYRQKSASFHATGVLGDLTIAGYDAGLVKRHEKTISKTRRKMAKYMRTARVFGNPPVTAIRPNDSFDQAVAESIVGEPDSAFETVDGVSHELWMLEGADADRICALLPSEAYITDGHHRLASASLVAGEDGNEDPRIPAGVFSADQFRLRSFARSITDPSLDTGVALAELEAQFDVRQVSASEAMSPASPLEFGARVGRTHHLVRIPSPLVPDHHYSALNTNLLQDLILGPVFGVDEPRTDGRLDFVADLGDIVGECEDADVWFLPHPLSVDDVMAVADSAKTMPAKSTWFAPKLPSGLVIRPI